MRIALFIPCYIDQFYPQVGIATYQLLLKLGCDVTYPLNQTCCGQPLANSGFAAAAKACDQNFIACFKGYDYIVGPSGSCILHVKEHIKEIGNGLNKGHQQNRIYELTEFLTDVLKVDAINARFPHRVGLHTSCHGQRGLGLSSMSERMEPAFSKPEKLLQTVKGIQLFTPKCIDECCGFGGTFSIFEEAVSVKMGKDRLRDHEQHHVEFITSADVSCLMHLEGLLKRSGSGIRTIHIAEILNSDS